MNPIQKIALWWYRTIDTSGLIFEVVKSVNLFFRLLFYSAFIITFYFTFKIIGSFIDFSGYSLSQWVLLLIDIVGQIILYGAVTLSTLIITSESILKVDVKEELKKYKEKKQHIKENKLQWWRFRNMNLFVRLLIYVAIYFLLVYFLNVFAFAAYQTSPTVSIDIYIKEFQSILNWFFISFVSLIIINEYFVKRIKNKREVKL